MQKFFFDVPDGDVTPNFERASLVDIDALRAYAAALCGKTLNPNEATSWQGEK